MKKYGLIALLVLLGSGSFAQIGVSGGGTVLKSFGIKGAYPGIHLGVEVPRDDMVSFFGRMVLTLPSYVADTILVEAIDPTTTFPSTKYVPTRFGNSYLNFACGTRYYLGNGYDYGISAYGGSTFEISTMGVKRGATGEFDDTKYQFISSSGNEFADRGRVIMMNLGLSAGVKYNFFFGVVYLDITGSYLLFNIASNEFAAYYARVSPLMFSVNVGYRKDIFR